MTYQAIADAAGVDTATAYRATKDVELLHLQKLPGKDGKLYPPAYARKQERRQERERVEAGPMPTGASP